MRVVNSFLDRCAEALEVMARSQGDLALGDIAARLDIPKSAAHRLLSALSGVGWVDQDPDSGFYRLTLKLALLGQRMIGSKLPEIYQPVLDRLAAETHELIRLALVDGSGLVWVAIAQGAQSGLIYQPNTVARVPLHASANGKAWLSSLPTEEAVAAVLQEGFGRKGQFGPNAVNSLDGLLREIETTRAQGWAVAWEETEPGVAAVAVPINPSGSKVVATMSVAGPIFRMTKDRLPQVAEQLKRAATEIAAAWPSPN